MDGSKNRGAAPAPRLGQPAIRREAIMTDDSLRRKAIKKYFALNGAAPGNSAAVMDFSEPISHIVSCYGHFDLRRHSQEFCAGTVCLRARRHHDNVAGCKRAARPARPSTAVAGTQQILFG